MGRHAIPLPTDRLRTFIDTPGRRDYATTLAECLPDRTPADAGRTFDVRVARVLDGPTEPEPPRVARLEGGRRGRPSFEELWAAHGRFAPSLKRKAEPRIAS